MTRISPAFPIVAGALTLTFLWVVAWYWPTADLSRLLNASGFSVSAVATRTDAATTRTVGTLHAVRSGDEPAA